MGSHGPTTRPFDVVFRAPNGVDSHNYHCRGSITQPMRSLCTLYVDGESDTFKWPHFEG